MFLRKIKALNNTLLFRLTVLYAISFALIASLGFGLVYYRISSIAIQELDEELMDEVEDFSDLISRNDVAKTREILLQIKQYEDSDEEFYRLLTENGEVIDSSDMTGWRSLNLADNFRKLQEGHASFLYHTVSTEGENQKKARIITAAISDTLFFQLGETLEEVDEYLAIYRQLFVFLILVLTIITAATGWLISKWALSDILMISETAESIGKGAYDSRVDESGLFEETKRLAATFNNMVGRITSIMSSMKDINDSIAHDLRSPLARIRGGAEMALTQRSSVETYGEMASSTIEECDRLMNMINTMLDLAETEAGMTPKTMEHFNLTELINEACELYHPLAQAKNIELLSTLDDQELFRGDKKRMQRIVTNLLENSIKYTEDGGKVQVHATRKKGHISITIEDSGIGISEQDIPRIYDRFFRCDKSRPQGGFGLGLSLAKAYTESMNGIIDVKSSLAQGTIFTISFQQQLTNPLLSR